jgi:hypothetical protein
MSNPANDEQMRKDFEAAAKELFTCGESSFVKCSSGPYINHVQSHTFGGRKQPDYAAVSMLWDVWQAATLAERERQVERGTP